MLQCAGRLLLWPVLLHVDWGSGIKKRGGGTYWEDWILILTKIICRKCKFFIFIYSPKSPLPMLISRVYLLWSTVTLRQRSGLWILLARLLSRTWHWKLDIESIDSTSASSCFFFFPLSCSSLHINVCTSILSNSSKLAFPWTILLFSF